MFDKGQSIRIREAEGTRSQVRTCYAVTDDGWYDTQGTYWPVADNDQLTYTREDTRR